MSKQKIAFFKKKIQMLVVGKRVKFISLSLRSFSSSGLSSKEHLQKYIEEQEKQTTVKGVERMIEMNLHSSDEDSPFTLLEVLY